MSTLIRNVGILDARKATPEKLLGIGKLDSIGVLVINPEIKEQLTKISMTNVGSTLELTEDYKFHIGTLQISKQFLENSTIPIKLVVVGQISVDADIPPALLAEKMGALYLVGQAAVPEELYGIFMEKMKELTGMVDVVPSAGQAITGKVTINDSYLNSLPDKTELNVVGKVIFEDDIDSQLFETKITALRVTGVISCSDTQEAMMRKVFQDTGKTKLRISRSDCQTIADGSRLDPFSLLSIEKATVCCSGVIVLDEQIDADILQETKLKFEAVAVYFPAPLIKLMLTRLGKNTKGMAYNAGSLELITGDQQMTKVRLEAMQDNCTLVLSGALSFDPEISPQAISSKIASLDNFGHITASRDVASILQSKLRINQGAIKPIAEEETDKEAEKYDHVIENVANYVL